MVVISLGFKGECPYYFIYSSDKERVAAGPLHRMYNPCSKSLTRGGIRVGLLPMYNLKFGKSLKFYMQLACGV